MAKSKSEQEIIAGFDQLLQDQREHERTKVLTLGDFLRDKERYKHDERYFAMAYEALGFSTKRPELFPAFRFRVEPGKVIALNLFPQMTVSPTSLSNKIYFIDIENPEMIRVNRATVGALRPHILHAENQLTFNYQLIEFDVEFLERPPHGEDTVNYLMKNRDVNYLVHDFAKTLHYHLGFPPREFDNLGFFWHGHFADLREAFLQSL